MLKTLRIRNLAVIEELTVDFGPGLNVLTGETGAGKSILVDALGLAAGDRGDSSMVRTGADRAVIEAAFQGEPPSGLRPLAGRRGWDLDGDELVVRREVAESGSGRVFLNGSPSTVGALREAGDLLVELHGQHEHQSLLSPARHLELLDGFGGHESKRSAVEHAHGEVVAAAEALAGLQETAAERERLVAGLRETVREIESVDPKPGELDSVDRERTVLRNAEQVATLLDEVVGLLYDGDATAATLSAAAARRAAALAEIDPSLRETAERIEGARLELEDAGAALRDYRDRTDFDPSRLEGLEARRAALEKLLLQYGPDEGAALERLETARAELRTLDHVDEEIERARRARVEAERRFVSVAAELTDARRRAGGRLKRRVEEQLATLALERAAFSLSFHRPRGARLESDPDHPLDRAGAERAEFRLAANPGEADRPLARVASGGELSRIMLALHVVLESAGTGRVLVFDEVDAGISGAVADAVGARLAALSRDHQVLCVTHLPQVAAHADRHYHVSKSVSGSRTRVGVAELEGKARVDELARMMGGRKATASSSRHAAELLAAAARARRA